MTNEHITDRTLDDAARAIAADALREMTEFDLPEDEAFDFIYQSCDGHELVIYYHKARQVCANCDVEAGEQYLCDIGLPDDATFDRLATIIAFGELENRAQGFFREMLEEREADK